MINKKGLTFVDNQALMRGFTLIEMLVIVVIVAILSLTVFVVLSSAAIKAKDANILADVNQIKFKTEKYYAANGTYNGYCKNVTMRATPINIPASVKDLDVVTLAIEVTSQGGGSQSCIDNAAIQPSAFAYSVKFNKRPSICFDSSGSVFESKVATNPNVTNPLPHCE